MSKPKSKKVIVKRKESEQTLGGKIGKALLTYLTTQFVLMILVGLATWGILSLLHVGYPILLAVMTGVLSGVPGFGMTVSTIIIALVAILDNTNMWTNSPSWLEALIILVLFFVFNKFIDLIIGPIFLGKTNKVNPFVVVILVVLGTVFMGIPGAILAMPIYLVIKTTLEHFEGK